ncbi:MAG TPA: Xaa-Pro aminopeptidase [Mycobacteriales bacterium]|nr:Xaa-Pro aminopeptidase [Mycobacteriales bacterium]
MTDKRASHDSGISAALAQSLLTGWAPDAPRSPEISDVAPYTAKRRAALAAAFPGETLVVPSGVPKVRANDTDYPFRASSDYVWLTGDTEPDGVLVLHPSGDAVLYVPARVPRGSIDFFADRGRGELWVGRRPDPQETAARLGISCQPRRELDGSRLGSVRVLRGTGDPVEQELAADQARDAQLAQVCAELRLIKDDWELGQLREATAATARGFADVLAERRGARQFGERWLEGTFWRRARAEGNDVGYSSVVACGPHATTLHWNRNNGPVDDGDLLLLDMGIELTSLYTADVTRTVPVGGRFSPAQRQVYELVLAAQQAGFAAAEPGADFLAPNRAAMRVLAAGLHDWGILPVGADDVVTDDDSAPAAGLHRRYTLHNVSHMLGLDVHDCAHARQERYLRGALRPGMVLTVEPGLYFQPDDLTVPPELRGVGVRIEDDIAITTDGAQNLSDQLPHRADDVERWVASCAS